jgi:hypothetical protein
MMMRIRIGIASGRRREEETTRADRNPRKPADPISTGKRELIV